MVGVLCGSLPSAAKSSDLFNNSGLKIPRFVTLSSNKVFVRTGPALRYPIKWVFVKKRLPVEVVQEFDTWRKIRDLDGEEGWIHQSLLSGKRSGIVISDGGAYVMRKADAESKFVAMLEKGVVAAIEECSGVWCEVEAEGYKGWIKRKLLWGVYEDEELD